MQCAQIDLPKPETIARFTLRVELPPEVRRHTKPRSKAIRWTPDAILAYHRERRARNVAKGLRADGTPRTPRISKWSKSRNDYHRARRAAFKKEGLTAAGKPFKPKRIGPYGPSKNKKAYMKRYRAAIYRRDLCPV